MHLQSTRLGRDIELPQGRTRIGRHSDCFIVLDSPSVSKFHLEFKREGDQLSIRDETSRNNSSVNRRQIRGMGWIKLSPNDVVDVCGFDFRVMREDTPEGASGSCVIDLGDDGASDLSSEGSKSIPLSKHDLAAAHEFSSLRALLAITSTLRDVLQTEAVLERAVDILFNIFPSVDRAAICFIDEHGSFEPKWWQVRERDPDRTIKVSQSIGRHVAESSQAVITHDAKIEYGEALSVQALPMRSVMCCPLIDADGHVFGLIHVDTVKPAAFAELDLEVLAAVALQISLAINCSRLHALAVEDAILRRDIEQAIEVQQRYLPERPPEVAGYDLAGFYRPARHVGGDYFDYIELSDNRLAIVLGDVVGKGVPAALTMVRLATETRSELLKSTSPSEVVTKLNQTFVDDFITLAVLILDRDSGKVTISNAGHEPPLLRTPDGKVTPFGFDSSGCPFSVLEDYSYDESTMVLQPGESVTIFSDGFPDALHFKRDERFGSERIAGLLGEFDGPAEKTIEHLVGAVDQYMEDNPQFDDMCMVCLKREQPASTDGSRE